ncbi:hypothetical protein [Flagellimonas olearia]|nr:hypothetical protein [Allomuricauda olearia]
MRVNLANREYFMLIEQGLYKKMKKLVNTNNRKYPKGRNHLNIDYLVFVIDLIEQKSIEHKDNLTKGHVRLKASYLKKYFWNYKRHIDFLESNDFISKRPYIINKNLSHGYKVIYPVNQKLKIVKHLCSQTEFTKNLVDFENRTCEITDETTEHLTKWLNTNQISFDYESAMKFITNSTDLSIRQKYQRMLICEKLSHGLIYYRRLAKDRRLHTTITSLPKELRPFLSFKGDKLVSLDLKSSQPYFLCGLISELINTSGEGLVFGGLKRRFREKISEVYTVTILSTPQNTVYEELSKFIDLVLTNDIYEHVGNNFSEEFLEEIQGPNGHIQDKFYVLSKGYKQRKQFKTLRDYCKKAVLEYLYCSPNSHEKRIKEIRRIFPDSVNRIVNMLKFKDEEKKFNRNDFALILQNIEAYFIIDIITKTIAEERPDLFMLTIHDSIICTVDNMKYVHDTMMDIFIGMLGIAPNIVFEPWFQVTEESTKVQKIA